MRIAALTAVVLLAGTACALAQAHKLDMTTDPSGISWGPAPPIFAKGAQIAVLSGDPSKAGPYVVRLKMPANYAIQPHYHPTTENVTIISGSFHAGMGDKLDKGRSQEFKPGGFVAMPAGMHHYAWTSEDTVVQVHGQGPFALTYVNESNDPRRSQ